MKEIYMKSEPKDSSTYSIPEEGEINFPEDEHVIKFRQTGYKVLGRERLQGKSDHVRYDLEEESYKKLLEVLEDENNYLDKDAEDPIKVVPPGRIGKEIRENIMEEDPEAVEKMKKTIEDEEYLDAYLIANKNHLTDSITDRRVKGSVEKEHIFELWNGLKDEGEEDRALDVVFRFGRDYRDMSRKSDLTFGDALNKLRSRRLELIEE